MKTVASISVSQLVSDHKRSHRPMAEEMPMEIWELVSNMADRVDYATVDLFIMAFLEDSKMVWLELRREMESSCPVLVCATRSDEVVCLVRLAKVWLARQQSIMREDLRPRNFELVTSSNRIVIYLESHHPPSEYCHLHLSTYSRPSGSIAVRHVHPPS